MLLRNLERGKEVIPMAQVEEEIDDLEVEGAEIAYLVSDMNKYLEGKNISQMIRRRIISAGKKAYQAMRQLESVRVALGMKKKTIG